MRTSVAKLLLLTFCVAFCLSVFYVNHDAPYEQSEVMKMLDIEFFESNAKAVERTVDIGGGGGGIGGRFEPLTDMGLIEIHGSEEFPIEEYLQTLESATVQLLEKNANFESSKRISVDDTINGFFASWLTETNQGFIEFYYLDSQEFPRYKGFPHLQTGYYFRYRIMEWRVRR